MILGRRTERRLWPLLPDSADVSRFATLEPSQEGYVQKLEGVVEPRALQGHCVIVLHC